ncbi:HalOD1 output domain-containing protein [Saliphagus sp. LR7]|uniref:HalOD1 output domain-containing protein n=1 Tax=Saliphagus sp. LR7 TaxID=2282654 RepID=UPI000DF83465|nr:HalOD1 output domain-containing protein [Saliphagus sp. LR7]
MGEFEGDGQEVRKEFNWSEVLPSVAIIRGVAALEDVDSAEVSAACGKPLFSVVDPDALDKLVTRSEDLFLSFSFQDYSVEISESTVVVTAS